MRRAVLLEIAFNRKKLSLYPKIFTKIDGFLYSILSMKIKSTDCCASFYFVFPPFAQEKITVESIYSGTFRAKGMDELQSLKKYQPIYGAQF